MLSLKDKAAAVVEWCSDWQGFGGYLKLNALVALQGDATLVTEPSDAVVTEYIDGTARRRFMFSLRLVLPWSDGFDTVNADSMAQAVSLYDWAVAQNEAGNYPDWKGSRFYSLEPTQTFPAVNMVYQEDGLAEYLIQFVIDYEE